MEIFFGNFPLKKGKTPQWTDFCQLQVPTNFHTNFSREFHKSVFTRILNHQRIVDDINGGFKVPRQGNVRSDLTCSHTGLISAVQQEWRAKPLVAILKKDLAHRYMK